MYHKCNLKRIYKTLTRTRGLEDALGLTQKMRRFSPSRWRRPWVLEVEGQHVHWEQGGHGALGETTHNPCAVAGELSDTLAAEGGGEELLTPCLFQFSLFFKTLSWPQLRASSWVWKEHHKQTWMLTGPGHKPLCCLPHGSSLFRSICFWLWANL